MRHKYLNTPITHWLTLAIAFYLFLYCLFVSTNLAVNRYYTITQATAYLKVYSKPTSLLYIKQELSYAAHCLIQYVWIKVNLWCNTLRFEVEIDYYLALFKTCRGSVESHSVEILFHIRNGISSKHASNLQFYPTLCTATISGQVAIQYNTSLINTCRGRLLDNPQRVLALTGS